MLRLVSFNMDYHWAWNRQGVTGVDGSYHQHWDAVPHFFYRGKAGEALSEKQRKALAHPLEMYSFINYLAYVLYPPLYIAGPIITFNDFMWQVRLPNLATCAVCSSAFIASSAIGDTPAITLPLLCQIFDMSLDDGVGPSFYVRCCHQGHESVDRGHARTTEHDWLLEPSHHLVKGSDPFSYQHS